MATSVLCLGQLCSAAAASGDLLAATTPTHSVVLLRRSGSSWQREHELTESHEGTITALAFTGGGGSGGAASSSTLPLRLASSSHDRGSYVWTQQQQQEPHQGGRNGEQQGQAKPLPQQQQGQGQGQWRAELVITRLAKAGLCCAWAPGGLKYAIGSSDRLVDVIYLDASRELWAPRLIKKRHGSAVMALAWHPSGGLLATAAADSRLRLLNAVVPEVDGRPDLPVLSSRRFGDCLLELPLPGAWGLAAAFSPSGSCLAVASQGAEGSHLTLLSGIDLQQPSSLDAAAAAASAAAGEAGGGSGPASLQHLQLPGLPLKCLAFLSDSLLVGGGFDCQPQLFQRRADGQWQYLRSLQGVQASTQAGRPQQAASSSLSARIRMFEQQAAAAGTSSSRTAAAAGQAAAPVAGGGEGSGSSTGGQQQQQEQQGGPHENCIISISPLCSSSGGDGSLQFVTASLEGCIAEWHINPASL